MDLVDSLNDQPMVGRTRLPVLTTLKKSHKFIKF